MYTVPTKPFGRELVYVEGTTRYRLEIPEVEVEFRGTKMNLQDVVGAMGIYQSISLLKIGQNGGKPNEEFKISPLEPDALAGRLRVMNFMRTGLCWAHADEHGFPDGDYPAMSTFPQARRGVIRGIFDDGSTGWHGSPTYDPGMYEGRGVYAYVNWAWELPVAIIGRAAPG